MEEDILYILWCKNVFIVDSLRYIRCLNARFETRCCNHDVWWLPGVYSTRLDPQDVRLFREEKQRGYFWKKNPVVILARKTTSLLLGKKTFAWFFQNFLNSPPRVFSPIIACDMVCCWVKIGPNYGFCIMTFNRNSSIVMWWNKALLNGLARKPEFLMFNSTGDEQGGRRLGVLPHWWPRDHNVAGMRMSQLK